jgi:LysR family transcriptional regulator, glycine cleavage system transcriptional activator
MNGATQQMVKSLPPLNALRAFEAAARHLSFAKAADELNVTPAALSHQMKSLEEHLGVALFHRRARGIALTEAGLRLYPGTHSAFEGLRSAVERVSRRQTDRVLVVSAGPGFTAKWLAPRLYRFVDSHPEIDARISASAVPVDFATDDVDVSIRVSLGDHPGLHVERLMEERMLPLCSPRLLEGANALKTPADLSHVPLIHIDLPPPFPQGATWSYWLDQAGVTGIDPDRGLRFNVVDHALDAAIAGAGVVMGHKVIASYDIAAKRLVCPFGPELPMFGRFYHLVCARGQQSRPKVRAFRDWLFAEIQRPDAAPDVAGIGTAITPPGTSGS